MFKQSHTNLHNSQLNIGGGLAVQGHIKLSENAIKELKEILRNEQIEFSDEELQESGLLLLTILAEALKMR